MTNRYRTETWDRTGIHMLWTTGGTFSRHWHSGDIRSWLTTEHISA